MVNTFRTTSITNHRPYHFKMKLEIIWGLYGYNMDWCPENTFKTNWDSGRRNKASVDPSGSYILSVTDLLRKSTAWNKLKDDSREMYGVASTLTLFRPDIGSDSNFFPTRAPFSVPSRGHYLMLHEIKKVKLLYLQSHLKFQTWHRLREFKSKW
jgi:hypothetical protein